MQNIELAFKLTESLEKARQILEDIEAFECKIQKKFNDFIVKEFGDEYAVMDFDDTPEYTENIIFGDGLYFNFYVGERVGYKCTRFDYEYDKIPENRVTHIYRTNLQIGIYFDNTISKRNYIRDKFSELIDEFLYETKD